MRGEGQREHIICNALYEQPFEVPLRVTTCNRYDDKRTDRPSLSTMKDMAFILTEDTPLKSIGFVSPKEWRKKHKDDDVLPPDIRRFP